MPVAFCIAGAIFLLVGSLESTQFASFTVQGVALGMIYGSLALALVLIYQATHVINFAQGELAMFTTYIAYQLIQWGLPYWGAFFVTLAIAFVLGVGLQVTVIRPVQHRSVVATVIVTIGLFLVIDGIVGWIWGGQLLTMPPPFGLVSEQFDVGGVFIEHLYVGTVVVVLVSLAAVWGLFRFTKLGLAMRAAALRPAAASLAGVRVDTMLAIGWGLAAVLGAVAGLMAEPPTVPPRAGLHAADPRLRVRRRRARRTGEPRGRRHRRRRDRRPPDPCHRLRPADQLEPAAPVRVRA